MLPLQPAVGASMDETDTANHLILGLLSKSPEKRLPSRQALSHDFFKDCWEEDEDESKEIVRYDIQMEPYDK